jgi:predicted AlkP superfamily phosphohydrolase/phosphomutase
MRFNETANIVVDCDEVLTNISPLWVQKIHDNREKFEKYFNLFNSFDHKNEEDYEKVLSRSEFYLNKWLMKEGLILTKEEEKKLFKEFFDLYDNDDFYMECEPTKMCEGIYKLSLQSFVDKIFVVTRTTEGNKKSKERFINAYLNSPKVEIIYVGSNEKKSDYIKKLSNVKMVVEDELKNIHDIIDNCKNLEYCDIYVPYTGYNQPDADLFEKADENKFKLLYYPIFRKTIISNAI